MADDTPQIKPAQTPVAAIADDDYISLDELLNCRNVRYVDVVVPELPNTSNGRSQRVRLGSVTAAEVIEWAEANEDPQKRRIAGLRLLNKSVVNRANARTGTESTERRWIDMPAAITNLLVDQVMRLNRMGKYGEVAAIKNDSGGAVSVASPTA